MDANLKKLNVPDERSDTRKNSQNSVHSSYHAVQKDTEGSVSLIISVKEEVGSLSSILKIFKKNKVNLMHIESRQSPIAKNEYDFMVNADNTCGGLETSIEQIRQQNIRVQVLARGPVATEGQVPWFPQKIVDLDRFANQILTYGAELDSDHPGFTDEEYRKKRKTFADIAFNYKHGQPIPRVEYDATDTETWRKIYDSLCHLYPSHACKEFNYCFPLLQQNCKYNRDAIPQLQDISEYMKSCTGFQLRPVAGLLSSRDFLAGLAFRVFHSTQYIRHHAKPFYTPEPDVCHEILGHVPMFCDPTFAQFSQELGLASLGASDEDIEKLATCYWFTVEFGICKENGKNKAYGAGLLSSFGELEYCVSDKPEIRNFNPEVTGKQKFPITEYQPVYFCTESFNEMKEQMISFSKTMKRPFSIRYNAYTQSVEVIDKKNQIENVINEIKVDLNIVQDALLKLRVF